VSRIHGIAGTFLHAHQPERLADWYALHFGLAFASHAPDTFHAAFPFRDDTDPAMRWSTVFAILPATSPPGTPPGAERGEYTITYRVDDLRALAEQLAAGGVAVEPIQQESDGPLPESRGLFTRLRDPEGNYIELYQPL
jgi:catechol 2,3-dioxygenase-like lactoylglutathione lyase family enzyme